MKRSPVRYLDSSLKSSYSNGGENACVEVASTDGVLVCDTINHDGATLTFSARAWERFTASLH